VPFWVGAGATVVGVAVLLSGRRVLAHAVDHDLSPGSRDEADALTAGDAG